MVLRVYCPDINISITVEQDPRRPLKEFAAVYILLHSYVISRITFENRILRSHRAPEYIEKYANYDNTRTVDHGFVLLLGSN